MMLRRWKKNGAVDGSRHSLQTPSLPSPTSKTAVSKPRVQSAERLPDAAVPSGAGAAGGERDLQETCRSPLFEEFSDNEFEVVREGRLDSEREGDGGEAGHGTEREMVRGERDEMEDKMDRDGEGEEGGGMEGERRGSSEKLAEVTTVAENPVMEEESDLSIANSSGISDISLETKPHPSKQAQTPPPPSTPPGAVDISDISSDMEHRDHSLTDGDSSTPQPPAHLHVHVPPLTEVDTSAGGEGEKAEADSELTAEKEDEKSGDSKERESGDKSVEVIRKTKSLEELMMSEDAESYGASGGGRMGSEEEAQMGRREEGYGIRREGRGGKSLEDLMVMDMASGGAGREGEADVGWLGAPDPRDSQGQLGGKTPGKRKVTYNMICIAVVNVTISECECMDICIQVDYW